jgi:asparagine N-glycosylation enzyme membrane subunit Stt3
VHCFCKVLEAHAKFLYAVSNWWDASHGVIDAGAGMAIVDPFQQHVL